MDHTKAHTPFSPPLHPNYDIARVVQVALDEDAGDKGDVTTLSTIAETTEAVAKFLAKENGTIAGLGVADLVFNKVDPKLQVQWNVKDGDCVVKGQEFGIVQGSARSILIAERIALNFLQRMSGVATATAAMVGECSGYLVKVTDTRKTLPCHRILDKWAVLMGGGWNHRIGLFDMILIKDNHIVAAGGITSAVHRAEKFILDRGYQEMQIEVETETLDEVEELLSVVKSGQGPNVKRVLLDNMVRKDSGKDSGCDGGVDVSLLRQAVELVAGTIDTEASGNVSLGTIRKIASTGVTHISVGSITHSVKALDISLNIKTEAELEQA